MTPPNVLVNDRCLRRPAAGVAVYLRNILAAWPAEAVRVPVTFWTHPNPTAIATDESIAPLTLSPLKLLQPGNSLTGRLPWWARRIVQRHHSRAFARQFRRSNYTAYFEPNHLAIPTGGVTVTTMHDLSVIDHPQWHPRDRVRQWEASLAESLAATTRWIADSQFTARRMMEALHVPADRIDVIHLAARPLPWPTADQLAERRITLRLPPRYALHLGTLEPRKNIELLLDTWAALPSAVRRETKLVLAGGVGWGGESFWRRLSEHPLADEVLYSGYVSDAQAAYLLAGADVLLAPSHYEGFGLPILEAMAAGTPVLCSAAESFREVAGDAGRVLPDNDPAAWAQAVIHALNDPIWRSNRIAAGKAQAGRFSWQQAAAATAAVIERAVNEGR